MHDTCWSLTTGTDGVVYVGVCGEMTGGLSVYLASYSPEKNEKKYLLEVAEAIGVPADNGQATHSKIHYCLFPGEDGVIYGATHCTGAPLGDLIWRPWNSWKDQKKGFSGSKIFSYEPGKGEVLFVDTVMPEEGSRAMGIDQKRRKIYGVSYPRNHFFIYSIDSHRTLDLGRIGSINPQTVFVDEKGNGYTTDDYGNIIKCHAEKDELETLDVQVSHSDYRDGFHNVLYDATPSPDGKEIYCVTWSSEIRLFVFNPEKKKIYDLGRAYGESNFMWNGMDDNHVGGLVFGDDGNLYFSASITAEEEVDGKNGMVGRAYLIKMNTDNFKRELVTPIQDGDFHCHYVSRATKDKNGNLYFADIGNVPTRIIKFEPDYAKKTVKDKFTKNWG